MGRVVLFLILCGRCWADCALPRVGALDSKAPTVESLLDGGHFHRAKALVGDPVDGRTYWLMSRAEMGLGDLNAALKLAERAVALEESKSEFHVQLAAVNGRLAANASMFKQLGYATRAKKELDTAIKLNPENVDALYGLMLFYYAAPSFVGGDKAKAVEAADRMARLNPARGYLAQARLAKDRKDAAAELGYYKKAVEADAASYDAKAALAQYYLEDEHPDWKAAGKQACEAVNLEPGRVEAWRALATVEVRIQCWDELFTMLEAARSFVPEDGGYYYSAGETLARMGMHAAWGEQFLRTYLTGVMDDDQFVAQAHFHLGEALQKLERAAEAKAEFARALELDPGLGKR